MKITLSRPERAAATPARFIPASPTRTGVLDDPSGQTIEMVRAIRDDIKDRVEELLATLEMVPA